MPTSKRTTEIRVEVIVKNKPLNLARAAIPTSPFARLSRRRRTSSAERSRPSRGALRAAALRTGLLGPDTAGLTLGHAVLIRQGCDSVRLRSHEFRHVHQYEAAGSIKAFLDLYLRQILASGYAFAPFEVDARRHETDG